MRPVKPRQRNPPPGDCDVACRLAKAKKVSGAWIVRDVEEKYI